MSDKQINGKRFSGAERKELDFLLPDTAEAVELLITEGLTDAQNVIHAR